MGSGASGHELTRQRKLRIVSPTDAVKPKDASNGYSRKAHLKYQRFEGKVTENSAVILTLGIWNSLKTRKPIVVIGDLSNW